MNIRLLSLSFFPFLPSNLIFSIIVAIINYRQRPTWANVRPQSHLLFVFPFLPWLFALPLTAIFVRTNKVLIFFFVLAKLISLYLSSHQCHYFLVPHLETWCLTSVSLFSIWFLASRLPVTSHPLLSIASNALAVLQTSTSTPFFQ